LLDDMLYPLATEELWREVEGPTVLDAVSVKVEVAITHSVEFRIVEQVTTGVVVDLRECNASVDEAKATRQDLLSIIKYQNLQM